mmetsp:Transcript_38626/g.110186  ORF Transcript_38626/g.110186 Transcript_38626/m.110186 type:complete len:85 (+) Transcript_38626:966-1220(+)
MAKTMSATRHLMTGASVLVARRGPEVNSSPGRAYKAAERLHRLTATQPANTSLFHVQHKQVRPRAHDLRIRRRILAAPATMWAA